MRSSVIDANSSPKVEVRSPGYEPVSPPQMPKPKRPLVKPVRRSQAPRFFKFAPAEGWFVLALLAIALYSVVFSIISANWVSQSNWLLVSPAIGLLVGLLVAKTPRFPQAFLHLAACLAGHWLAVWLTSAVAFHFNWMLLISGLRDVITGNMPMGGPGSEVVFFFYLTFLCFFLGYFGSWLVYRAHLPWLVALVYCSIMLVNLNYTKRDLIYLFIVLLGALILLIARVQIIARVQQWSREGLYSDRGWLRAMTWRGMQATCVLMLLTLLISWVLPLQSQPGWGKTFWDRIDNAVNNVANGRVSLQDPSAIIMPYQAPTNFFGDQLTISGSVHLPTGEVLSYTSSQGPRYLEGFTYNVFDGHTWTTSVNSANNVAYSANAVLPLDSSRNDYSEVTTNIKLIQPPESTKHYLFAPAEPASFSIPTIVSSDGTAVAWMQQRPLVQGETYQVSSIAPPSDEQMLANVPLPNDSPNIWNAGGYPPRASYLQVPRDLSPAVPRLARQWTQGASNAYSLLKMLELHLSNQSAFKYSVDNPPIPASIDAVDWLLQTHIGYCTYYASAMAVMGRLLGIPTRVVNGFSYGHFDQQHKVWSVAGSDAHSWVQAYLPTFGWISFDPTPGYAPNALPTQHPTPTPPAAATKAPTHPSPTATAPGKIATPPPPKQQPAVSPPARPLAQSHGFITKQILIALAIGSLLFSFLLLLAAVVTYWWRNLYANSGLVASMFWRLCRLASWAGLSPRTWQTPYEYSGILAQHLPQHAKPLWHLTELFVRDRWGGPRQVPYAEEEQVVEQHWPRLCTTLVQLLVKRVKK